MTSNLKNLFKKCADVLTDITEYSIKGACYGIANPIFTAGICTEALSGKNMNTQKAFPHKDRRENTIVAALSATYTIASTAAVAATTNSIGDLYTAYMFINLTLPTAVGALYGAAKSSNSSVIKTASLQN